MRANELYGLACKRSVIALDSDAEAGTLTKRLISLMRVLNRRYSPGGGAKLVTLCVGEDVEITDELKENFPRMRFVPVEQLNAEGEFTTDFVQQFSSLNKKRLVLGVMPPIIGAY